MNIIKMFMAFFIVLTVVGCTSISRIDEDTQIDLSGRWNDTDSKLVADEMIADSLSSGWLKEFSEEAGRKPAVVVGLVKNKTLEFISTDTFIKNIERAFIVSGKVKVVQGGAAREELRTERGTQQDFASTATIKRIGGELGADFILQGVVNSIVDSNKKQEVVTYQTDMELTNIETGEKVWIGSKKIKKLINK